jgi:hypothetical protein
MALVTSCPVLNSASCMHLCSLGIGGGAAYWGLGWYALSLQLGWVRLAPRQRLAKEATKSSTSSICQRFTALVWAAQVLDKCAPGRNVVFQILGPASTALGCCPFDGGQVVERCTFSTLNGSTLSFQAADMPGSITTVLQGPTVQSATMHSTSCSQHRCCVIITMVLPMIARNHRRHRYLQADAVVLLLCRDAHPVPSNRVSIGCVLAYNLFFS